MPSEPHLRSFILPGPTLSAWHACRCWPPKHAPLPAVCPASFLAAPQVDACRIEAICKVKLKLNPDTVLDPEAPQGLHNAVRQLQRLQARFQIQIKMFFPWPVVHAMCACTGCSR